MIMCNTRAIVVPRKDTAEPINVGIAMARIGSLTIMAVVILEWILNGEPTASAVRLARLFALNPKINNK
jgi:hypothetical protein